MAELGPRDHVISALRQLLWLPDQQRITYKLCLLMHLVHIGRAPSYLDDVTASRDLSHRSRLRSANSHRCELSWITQTTGERGFSYAGPLAWNTQLTTLHELSTTSHPKRHLKAVFTCTYGH